MYFCANCSEIKTYSLSCQGNVIMFRKYTFGRIMEKSTQRVTLFIVIFALSTECSFQEPTLPDIQDKQETHYVPKPTNIDGYTLYKINTILQELANRPTLSHSERIVFISEKFLGTPYQGHRLHGSEEIPEKLVVDFRGLDCFTYLDYVAALYASHSQDEFFRNIVKTRYVDSEIRFDKRKHFFTDWANSRSKTAEDITARLSPHAITQPKLLNKKSHDQQYIKGIPVVERPITYIPRSAINRQLVNTLSPGDLIGIYTQLGGLDVTHVGFFIMTSQGPVFRHASSNKEAQSVVDSPFISYLSKYPGIVVLRMKPLCSV